MPDLFSNATRLDLICFLRDGEKGRSRILEDTPSRALEQQCRRIAAEMGRDITITRGVPGERVVTFLNGRSPELDEYN